MPKRPGTGRCWAAVDKDADLEDAIDEAARGQAYARARPEAQQHAERELEQPGPGEHGDQGPAARADEHGDGQDRRRTPEQQDEQSPRVAKAQPTAPSSIGTTTSTA